MSDPRTPAQTALSMVARYGRNNASEHARFAAMDARHDQIDAKATGNSKWFTAAVIREQYWRNVVDEINKPQLTG